MGTDRLSWLTFSLLGLSLALFAFGCAGKPCQTSSECGASEVCAAQRCQALSCSGSTLGSRSIPSTGQCRPLPACGNRDDVRGWKSCTDRAGRKKKLHRRPALPAGVLVDRDLRACACEAAGSNGTAPVGRRLSRLRRRRRLAPSSAAAPIRCPSIRVSGLSQTDCQADPALRRRVAATPSVCNCPADSDCVCGGDTGGGFECRNQDLRRLHHRERVHRPLGVRSVGSAGVRSADGAAYARAPRRSRTAARPPTCRSPAVSRSGGSLQRDGRVSCLAHSECHPVGSSCYCPANATLRAAAAATSPSASPTTGCTAATQTPTAAAISAARTTTRATSVRAADRLGRDRGSRRAARDKPAPARPRAASSRSPTRPAPRRRPPPAPASACPRAARATARSAATPIPPASRIYILECSPYGNAGGALTGCGGIAPNADGIAPERRLRRLPADLHRLRRQHLVGPSTRARACSCATRPSSTIRPTRFRT